jgi:hypothetical protein
MKLNGRINSKEHSAHIAQFEAYRRYKSHDNSACGPFSPFGGQPRLRRVNSNPRRLDSAFAGASFTLLQVLGLVLRPQRYQGPLLRSSMPSTRDCSIANPESATPKWRVGPFAPGSGHGA